MAAKPAQTQVCPETEKSNTREMIARVTFKSRGLFNDQMVDNAFATYATNPEGLDDLRMAVFTAYRTADAILAALPLLPSGQESASKAADALAWWLDQEGPDCVPVMEAYSNAARRSLREDVAAAIDVLRFTLPSGQEWRGIEAHKVMTAEEYLGLNLKGWHSVCWNYDGFGGVAIRYGEDAGTGHEEVKRLRTAMQEACDLLAERKRGHSARSPGHNARLCLQSALKTGSEK